jgi:hypothetical protein
VTDDERERAWAAVLDATAQTPGWAVGPRVDHGEGAQWHVAAVDLPVQGGPTPEPEARLMKYARKPTTAVRV